MPRTIWAISDLHLSFGTPNKKMDLFGPDWIGSNVSVVVSFRWKSFKRKWNKFFYFLQ